jgi:hypothetical protein
VFALVNAQNIIVSSIELISSSEEEEEEEEFLRSDDSKQKYVSV